MRLSSGIYWGKIMHHRFSPKRHFFTYPIFMFALDLDEVEPLGKKLRLFAHNHSSLYTLRDGDHMEPFVGAGFNPAPTKTPAPTMESLKPRVINLLRQRGYQGPVDRIVMITQLRVLGYLFNPVSFFYCYADGVEVAHVAEVGNTFHQKHCYVFFDGVSAGQNSHWAEKVFYVSPFLEMDLTYNFRFAPLGESLRVDVDDYKSDQLTGKEPVLKTHIQGKYRPFTDWNLLLSFLKIPFMSVWIIAWIHWHALKLWFKKIPVVFRPLDGMKPGWKETENAA